MSNADFTTRTRLVLLTLGAVAGCVAAGFVLMPSACPCGRTIAPGTMANYETMVRLAAG